jgi:RNA polymerase sigma-70 factor (ECF subfamily)
MRREGTTRKRCAMTTRGLLVLPAAATVSATSITPASADTPQVDQFRFVGLDEGTIRGCPVHDASGFEAVFEREYAAVRGTVFLLCHDRELAEDIAQDSFVELLRNWSRVSGYERPGAWVRRIAIRRTWKCVRRESHRRLLERRTWDRVAEQDDGHATGVSEAVGALPYQQRAAVVLHYYEGASLAEVATILGCTPSTAGVHLHRARRTLAGRLEGVAHVSR